MNIREAPYKVAQSASSQSRERSILTFKSVARFVGEYTPLSYVLEPIVRSSSLYTVTAKTGAGKTALLVTTALAVAAGRPDILNLEVTRGRVAYLACENPDDIRMRIAVAAFLFGIDLDELDDRLVILDRREKPEAVHEVLARMAAVEPFVLVIVDTLAAFFDGDDINNAVQGGQFMRRLRPLCQIAGKPSVLVAAHPVKNASEEVLVPYGSGAILNEVDGNLTLWKRPETGVVALHWQGKLRGLEFQPAHYRFEITSCPGIVDIKGRQVELPTLRPSTEEVADDREMAEADAARRLLMVMIETPAGTQREWADAARISKSAVGRKLQDLRKEKLVEHLLGRWAVTPKGRKVAE